MTNKQPSSMYRQSALDSHYMHKYGKVCILPKLAHTGLFLSIFSLVSLAIFFVSTQPYFDTVNIVGWVNTTTANIEVRSQEAAGIVEKVFVTNGSEIDVGDAIATINRAHGEVLGKQGIATKRLHILQMQSNRVAILKKRTANLLVEADGFNEREIQSKNQIDKLLLHQQTLKNQLAISKIRWQKVKQLATKGTVTIVQVEQSELQMLTLHQQDFELFMQLQSLQTTQAHNAEQMLINRQQLSQVQNEENLINIETEQELNSLLNNTQFTIFAPSAGHVDNLQIEPGKSVSFNQVLTQIAPLNASYYIQLAIPSFQVAFLQKNQQVQIKVDGFAYQKYGSLAGVVTHISKQVIAPNEVTGLAVAANQPVYLVNIAIEQTQINPSKNSIVLRSGMTVSAAINKQESTLLEWIIAPLLESLLPKFSSSKEL